MKWIYFTPNPKRSTNYNNDFYIICNKNLEIFGKRKGDGIPLLVLSRVSQLVVTAIRARGHFLLRIMPFYNKINDMIDPYSLEIHRFYDRLIIRRRVYYGRSKS